MDQLPGIGQVPEHVKAQVTGKEVPRMVAIINSMTKKERRNPALLNGSRRARIARGSGMTPADVNKLMKQYQQMEKMMGKLSGGGMKGLMRGMQGMMGMGCPWCGPGMMGSGYATPQVNVNLSVSDVTTYLERWAAGNPNIKVANVVEKDANTITADILTKDKDALVQRYTFDRRTGFYHPVQ